MKFTFRKLWWKFLLGTYLLLAALFLIGPCRPAIDVTDDPSYGFLRYAGKCFVLPHGAVISNGENGTSRLMQNITGFDRPDLNEEGRTDLSREGEGAQFVLPETHVKIERLVVHIYEIDGPYYWIYGHILDGQFANTEVRMEVFFKFGNQNTGYPIIGLYEKDIAYCNAPATNE